MGYSTGNSLFFLRVRGGEASESVKWETNEGRQSRQREQHG